MPLALTTRLLNHYRYLVQRLLPGRNALQDQRRLLGRGGARVVFDVGAHVGQTAFAYRKVFPKALIYGFEPFEESFEVFRQSHARDPRVKPLRLGLADRPGTRTFYANQSSATNSLLPSSTDLGAYFEPEFLATRQVLQVDVSTVDQFMADQQIPRIDVLKLDVQGAELLVLRGAAGALERRAITLVYTEVEFVPLYQEQALFGDLLGYLSDAGYVFYNLYNLYSGLNGQLLGGDAVFVQPGLLGGIRSHRADGERLGTRRTARPRGS